MMSNSKLGIVGGGNMGRALVGGLLRKGLRPESIAVAESAETTRTGLQRDFGVTVSADPRQVVGDAHVVVLAVKPQDMRTVVLGIRESLQSIRPLVISVAAGIRTPALRSWCGPDIAIVRAMPNRPALAGAGVTGLFGAEGSDDRARETAERILGAVGATVWVASEDHLDVVTALSGSGPAYFFLLAESMMKAAVELGLAPDAARLLTVETLYGSGVQAHSSDGDLARMRAEVTSRGGTTEAAVASLTADGFSDAVSRAMAAATRRGRELADQFGADG